MAELSYKQFMDQIKARLEKLEAAQLRELILNMADHELPAHRPAFLTKLTLPRRSSKGGVNGKTLLNEIDALMKRVADGDYCEGWGWDDDLGEERDWGDESWANEVDGFFRQACTMMMQGDFETAETAYRKLFEILEMGEESGYLPGDSDYQDLLEVDLAEETAVLLRLIYLNTVAEERPDAVYEAMMEYTTWPHRIKLKDILEVVDTPLPDFEAFLIDWIDRLKGVNGSQTGDLLREAVMMQGGLPALRDLARESADRFPQTYVEWIKEVEASENSEELLQVVREGLERIPRDFRIRAKVADYLTRIGQKNNDRKMELEGYRECFYSDPSLPHLVDLYLAALECGCFEAVRLEAEARMGSLLNLKPDYQWHEPEIGTACASESELVNAWLLGGKLERVFEKCQNHGSLGWSSSDNPKPILITALMWALSGEGGYRHVMQSQWEEAIGNTRSVDDAEYCNKYCQLAKRVLKCLQFTPEQQEFYLEWCLDEVGKRIEAIVSNQHRGSYGKAARLLTSGAELLANRGRRQEGLDLVERYRNRYPRHTAFKSELLAALQQSRLMCRDLA